MDGFTGSAHRLCKLIRGAAVPRDDGVIPMKAILAAGFALAIGTVAAQAADFGGDGAAAPVVGPGRCDVTGLASFHTLISSASGYATGDALGFGGGGKANMCAGSMGLQLDAFGEVASGFAGDMADYNAGQFGGFAHFYMRDPNSHALGVLIGVGQIHDTYHVVNPGVLGTIGVDGHWYMDNFTIAGQAAFFNAFGQAPTSVSPGSGFLVTGELRYFPDPNIKLNLLLGYESDTDPSVNNTSHDVFLGAGAEYKFTNSPISVFANVVAHNNRWFGDQVNTVTGRLGLTAHFGQPTLLAEDRSGASFSTPFIDTWQNQANAFYR
jgi:hypothetical protein